MDFEEFVRKFRKAIKDKDGEFMKAVYSDWFNTSGVVPKGKEDEFFRTIFEELKGLADLPYERAENFDDFYIAHFKVPDGSVSMSFRKKGDSWSFFNERMNFIYFKNVYAISYDVDGEERISVLFNGKKSPVLKDIGSQGFVSLINAALRPGENEITLIPSKSGPLKVSIRIGSAKPGEIMDSAQENVLRWEGLVKDPVKLKFRAD